MDLTLLEVALHLLGLWRDSPACSCMIKAAIVFIVCIINCVLSSQGEMRSSQILLQLLILLLYCSLLGLEVHMRCRIHCQFVSLVSKGNISLLEVVLSKLGALSQTGFWAEFNFLGG